MVMRFAVGVPAMILHSPRSAVMKNSRSKRPGFSLIEMVIVVLILGIVAAVTAPRMFGQAQDAKENATKSQLAVLRNIVQLYYNEEGSMPDDETDLAPYLTGAFPTPQVEGLSGKSGLDTVTGQDSDGGPTPDSGNSAAFLVQEDTGRVRLNSSDPKLYGW